MYWRRASRPADLPLDDPGVREQRDLGPERLAVNPAHHQDRLLLRDREQRVRDAGGVGERRRGEIHPFTLRCSRDIIENDWLGNRLRSSFSGRGGRCCGVCRPGTPFRCRRIDSARAPTARPATRASADAPPISFLLPIDFLLRSGAYETECGVQTLEAAESKLRSLLELLVCFRQLLVQAPLMRLLRLLHKQTPMICE